MQEPSLGAAGILSGRFSSCASCARSAADSVGGAGLGEATGVDAETALGVVATAEPPEPHATRIAARHVIEKARSKPSTSCVVCVPIPQYAATGPNSVNKISVTERRPPRA